MKTFSNLWLYLSNVFFQTNAAEKTETHILCYENGAVYEIMSKNVMGDRGGEKWRHSVAHKRCTLDKQDYIHVHA